LIKDGRTLELLNRIDTVVFDKTGTLTEEQPHVGRIYCLAEQDEAGILRLAAAAEEKQTHPIARAILQEAKARQLQIPSIEDAAYKVGYGVVVISDHRTVYVGSVRFMEAENMYIPASIEAIQSECYAQGHSLVMVAMDDQVVGAIELHATIRPEAKTIVQGLHQLGITSIYIISGDHAAPTQKLAETLGIEQYFAETLPEHKADLIEKLQGEGRSVCYVGDGINDAIAMKRADVSVSLRGASTIATDTAQVILMDASLSSFCQLFTLARQYKQSMTTTFSSVLSLSVVSLGGMVIPYYGLAFSLAMSWISMLAGFASAMWPLMRHRWETPGEIGAVPHAGPMANPSAAAGTVPAAQTAGRKAIGSPGSTDDQENEAAIALNV
jgi:Cu2+-exporting ATPase